MLRFMFFCMAIIALSFVAVPVFNGISKERHALLKPSIMAVSEGGALSFEEIYEIAGQDANIAEQLNNIAPAAGNDMTDEFSSGFNQQNHNAF